MSENGQEDILDIKEEWDPDEVVVNSQKGEKTDLSDNQKPLTSATQNGVHKGKKDFSCLTCGKVFSAKRSLRGHVSNVHEKNGIPCPLCGKGFTRRENMKAHLLNVHDLSLIHI